MKASRENLIKCLEQIGWKVRHHGADYHYIYNSKGVNTHWLVWSDHIELDDYVGSFDDSPSCSFYFDSCKLSWLENNPKERERNTIALTAKGSGNSIFMYFANYDLNKKENL